MNSCKLTMTPEWGEIEKVRNKSSDFLAKQGLPNDSVHAFTMVISELVENSVKYGKFVSAYNEVIITISVTEDTIIAEVINPVDETVFKHLRKLDRTLQWIRGYQDPFQAYIERVRQISRRPFDDESNGLGLVRIAYEGSALLDFFLSEGNQLNVSAVTHV